MLQILRLIFVSTKVFLFFLMNNPKELEFHVEGLMENGDDVPEWGL